MKKYQLYIVLHFWGGYGEEPSVYYFKTQRPLFKFTDKQVAKVCGIDYDPSQGEWLQISSVDNPPILV